VCAASNRRLQTVWRRRYVLLSPSSSSSRVRVRLRRGRSTGRYERTGTGREKDRRERVSEREVTASRLHDYLRTTIIIIIIIIYARILYGFTRCTVVVVVAPTTSPPSAVGHSSWPVVGYTRIMHISYTCALYGVRARSRYTRLSARVLYAYIRYYYNT